MDVQVKNTNVCVNSFSNLLLLTLEALSACPALCTRACRAGERISLTPALAAGVLLLTCATWSGAAAAFWCRGRRPVTAAAPCGWCRRRR